jgi:heptosyltransferase III
VEKPFRKILVIKMRYHGDMLLTTPVISTLKQNYPDAKIDMLLYQDTIPILSENPEINALYGISNKGTGTFDKIKKNEDLAADQLKQRLIKSKKGKVMANPVLNT